MELKDINKVRKLLKESGPLMIFFRLDGCGHCEAMKGPYAELQKEMPDTKFYTVESQFVPSELGISGFPHFIKIDKGKKKSTGGEMTVDELKKQLGGRRTRHRTRRLTRRRR